MTIAWNTNGAAAGVTQITIVTPLVSPQSTTEVVRTLGAASNVTLTFTGGTMSPRKANISFEYPNNTTLQARELWEYFSNAAPNLLVNNAQWENVTSSVGTTNTTHTANASATDKTGRAYQLRVVLQVSIADNNFSNPVPGTQP